MLYNIEKSEESAKTLDTIQKYNKCNVTPSFKSCHGNDDDEISLI